MSSRGKVAEVVLGYWAVRGKAGVLRNLLAYCNIPFRNRLYTNLDDWFDKDKLQLGLTYPNIPYLIDGNNKVTETYAILHYIPLRAGKRDLIGETDDKFIQVQIVLNVVRDLRDNVRNLIATKGDFVREKEAAFTKGLIKAKLTALNKNLSNKEWLCGFLSIADFQLFEAVELIYEIDQSKLAEYPNLMSYYKRFLEVPEVQDHRKSKEFVRVWFRSGLAWNNATAEEQEKIPSFKLK